MPTICVQRCSVSRVAVQSSTRNAGQLVPVIVERLRRALVPEPGNVLLIRRLANFHYAGRVASGSFARREVLRTSVMVGQATSAPARSSTARVVQTVIRAVPAALPRERPPAPPSTTRHSRGATANASAARRYGAGLPGLYVIGADQDVKHRHVSCGQPPRRQGPYSQGRDRPRSAAHGRNPRQGTRHSDQSGGVFLLSALTARLPPRGSRAARTPARPPAPDVHAPSPAGPRPDTSCAAAQPRAEDDHQLARRYVRTDNTRR